jgi:hypothetical protein
VMSLLMGLFILSFSKKPFEMSFADCLFSSREHHHPLLLRESIVSHKLQARQPKSKQHDYNIHEIHSCSPSCLFAVSAPSVGGPRCSEARQPRRHHETTSMVRHNQLCASGIGFHGI